MLTWLYPAAASPDDTSASACALITLKLIFAAKVFHDAHPIGGGGTGVWVLVTATGTVRGWSWTWEYVTSRARSRIACFICWSPCP